jgi:hypothetical protein
MIPIQTATSSFNYSDKFYSYSLDHLVFLTHKELSHKLNWKYFPLKRGTFGYDSIAESIGRLLSEINIKTIEQGAVIVHNAWSLNYKWWRDFKPWVVLDKIYLKPTKPLGDKRRNDLANKSYYEIPEKEKETNKIISKFLLVDLLNLLKFNDRHPDDTFID